MRAPHRGLWSRHIGPLALFLIVTVGACLSHRSWERAEYVGCPSLDAPKMFFPLRHWGFQQIRAGEVPLWNPMILCGMPNVAEIQSAIFYPPNLLFAAMDTARAYNLVVGLHLFLSAAFTYSLLIYYGGSRSAGTVAGLTYMLCGPQVTHLWAGHLTMLCVIAWAPLLVALFDRAVRNTCWTSGLLGSLVLALQLLAGHPQCVLYSIHTLLLLGVCLAAWKFRRERSWSVLLRRLAILASCIAVAFGLAAVQLAPGWEFVPYSARAGAGYEWPGTHSLPPENLVSLLIPEFFLVLWREYPWESNAYVGIVPLLLALVAVALQRKGIVLFFAGLGVLTMLLALSRFTPLYHVAHYCIPGFSVFRGHAKYLVTMALALAALSGLGWDALLAAQRDRVGRIARSALGVSLLLAVVMGCLFLASERGSQAPDAWRKLLLWIGIDEPRVSPQSASLSWSMMLGSAIRTAILLGITAVWMGRALHHKRLGVAARWVGVLLVLLDLSLFAWKYLDVTPASSVTPTARASPGPLSLGRTATWRPGNENDAMLEGIPTAEGYVGNLPIRYREFFLAAQGENPDKMVFTFRRRGHSPLSALFGEKSEGLPRALLLPGPDAKKTDLYRPPVEDPDAVRLPGRASLWPRQVAALRDEPGGSVRVTGYANGIVTLSLAEASSEEGYAILTDTFYPGWRAFVDGEERRVLCADHTFRAVRVRPGEESRAELVYDPFSFRLGLAASLLCLCGWLTALAASFHRKGQCRQRAQLGDAVSGPMKGICRHGPHAVSSPTRLRRGGPLEELAEQE